MYTDFGPDRLQFAGLIPESPKKSIQYRLSAYNEVQIDAREGKWIKTDSQTFME